MEENSKKNNKNIIVLVAVVILIGIIIGIFLITNKKPEQKPVVVEEKIIPEKYEYSKYKVDYLNTKMSKLDFSNIENDKATNSGFTTYSIEIDLNKVKVTIELNENKYIKRTYTIDSIKKPISVGIEGSVEGNGLLVAYILDSDGQVYKITDDIGEVRKDEKYTGKAVKLNVNTAESISVPHSKLSLQDNPTYVRPRIYIKTKDGKILTDEILYEGQNGIIEVVSSGLETEKEEVVEEDKYEKNDKFTTTGLYNNLSFILDNTIQQHPINNNHDIKDALSYNNNLFVKERYKMEFAFQYAINKKYIKPVGEDVTRETGSYWLKKLDFDTIYTRVYDQTPFYSDSYYISDGYYKSAIFTGYLDTDAYRFIEVSNKKNKDNYYVSTADVYDSINNCIQENEDNEEYCTENAKKIGRIEIVYKIKDSDYVFKSISLFNN